MSDLDWACEDCAWAWPLPTDPPTGAECDSCGGRLVSEPCACDPVRYIVIGLYPETEHPDIWTTDLSSHDPGDGYFKVAAPKRLVEDLDLAAARWRAAVTAIVERLHFDPQTGCLPLCDDYDGQAHEWASGDGQTWDDCWRCGHDRDEHADV